MAELIATCGRCGQKRPTKFLMPDVEGGTGLRCRKVHRCLMLAEELRIRRAKAKRAREANAYNRARNLADGTSSPRRISRKRKVVKGQ